MVFDQRGQHVSHQMNVGSEWERTTEPEPEYASLEAAISFAARMHEGQVDKAGDPYILHPLRVMLAQDDTTLQIAAVLHDVVEDTDVILKNMATYGFSPDVLNLVDLLTRRRDEVYSEYLKRVTTSENATRIKVDDILDNLRRDRLRKLDPVVRARLEKKYYEALVILTGERLNQILTGGDVGPH